MKRKVIKQGPATLMVSLPSKWIKKYGIKKGQELEIEEKGGQLILGLKKQIEVEKTKIHVENVENFMRRVIHVPYRRGCDELEVTYSDPKLVQPISESLLETIGFEVVKQGNNFLLIKNVAKGVEEEFDVILDRFFMVIKTMGNNILEALKSNNSDLLEEVKTMEATAQKLYNFCCRQLYREGYKDESKTIFLYCIVRALERIGDHFNRQSYFLTGEVLYKKLRKKDPIERPKMDKEIAGIFSNVLDMLDFCYIMVKKFDYKKLLMVRDLEVETRRSISNRTMNKKQKSGEGIFLYYCLSTIEELAHMTEVLF